MNIEDALVEKLLKVFSLKSLEEIEVIVKKHMENPSDRYGQKELASRVVEVLFGKDAVKQAENISKVLFG
jgi:tyrosyl-tRNA synthetase